MKPLSPQSACHEQNQHDYAASVKRHPMRSIGRRLMTAIRSGLKSGPTSLVKRRPDHNHSLSHLNEHQLQDIGFTRDSVQSKIPTDIGLLQSGLHEHKRSQIYPLHKDGDEP